MSDLFVITDTERTIIALALDGKSTVEIAQVLSYTPGHVRFLWVGIYDKLGARNRCHALIMAYALGLVPLPDSILQLERNLL